jgi:hypothetical protein
MQLYVQLSRNRIPLQNHVSSVVDTLHIAEVRKICVTNKYQ